MHTLQSGLASQSKGFSEEEDMLQHRSGMQDHMCA